MTCDSDGAIHNWISSLFLMVDTERESDSIVHIKSIYICSQENYGIKVLATFSIYLTHSRHWKLLKKPEPSIYRHNIKIDIKQFKNTIYPNE